MTFHGVRGSTPCHGEDTRRYGGNTSCVAVGAPGEQPLLLDLGTGLRYAATARPAGPFRGTALLTHLHWDHVQGLPFFAPILQPGSELDIYGPGQGGTSATVAAALARLITPPAFPVPLFDLPGDIRVHDVEDATFAVGGFTVTSRLIPHVGPTCGFRVEWGGRSVVYIPDHQQPDDPLTIDDAVRELCAGADLLIHDAQYTPSEFAQKQTWGHCTVEYAVNVATQCKVGRLALFHHDPAHDDAMLDELERQAARCAHGFGVDVFSAREAHTVSV